MPVKNAVLLFALNHETWCQKWDLLPSSVETDHKKHLKLQLNKMNNHEEVQVPPTAQQSGSGAQNAGTASGSARSFRVPRYLPIPEKMVCQGDLTSNREFFKQHCRMTMKSQQV